MELEHTIPPTGEPIAVVYVASSWTEAIVVRGLLESAGIPSPALGDGYPPELGPLYGNIEIYALESQVDAARKVIADYIAETEGLEGEED